MTNFDPRRSEPRQSPVGPQPGFSGGRWIATFIVLIIVIALLAWGTDGWWGGNATNNAGNAAPQATTNGSGSNTPGVNGAQRPGTTGASRPKNNTSKP